MTFGCFCLKKCRDEKCRTFEGDLSRERRGQRGPEVEEDWQRLVNALTKFTTSRNFCFFCQTFLVSISVKRLFLQVNLSLKHVSISVSIPPTSVFSNKKILENFSLKKIVDVPWRLTSFCFNVILGFLENDDLLFFRIHLK